MHIALNVLKSFKKNKTFALPTAGDVFKTQKFHAIKIDIMNSQILMEINKLTCIISGKNKI